MLSHLLFIALAFQADPEPPIIVEGERPKEKAVCRTERETGSRMVKQICRTPTKAQNVLRMGNSSSEPTAVFVKPKGN